MPEHACPQEGAQVCCMHSHASRSCILHRSGRIVMLQPALSGVLSPSQVHPMAYWLAVRLEGQIQEGA
eukprot:scaffold49350_cov20-Tisochrysis_lutea.AAC.3